MKITKKHTRDKRESVCIEFYFGDELFTTLYPGFSWHGHQMFIFPKLAHMGYPNDSLILDKEGLKYGFETKVYEELLFVSLFEYIPSKVDGIGVVKLIRNQKAHELRRRFGYDGLPFRKDADKTGFVMTYLDFYTICEFFDSVWNPDPKLDVIDLKSCLSHGLSDSGFVRQRIDQLIFENQNNSLPGPKDGDYFFKKFADSYKYKTTDHDYHQFEAMRREPRFSIIENEEDSMNYELNNIQQYIKTGDFWWARRYVRRYSKHKTRLEMLKQKYEYGMKLQSRSKSSDDKKHPCDTMPPGGYGGQKITYPERVDIYGFTYIDMGDGVSRYGG